jgi:hypothetical protein
VDVGGQIHDPAAFYTPLPGKRTHVPIEWEADWAPATVGRFRVENCVLFLPRIEPPNVRPVAQSLCVYAVGSELQFEKSGLLC